MIGDGEAEHRRPRDARRGGAGGGGPRADGAGAKEGLALINGTQFSTACALAGLFGAWRAAQNALLDLGLSTDAIMGSTAPLRAEIHALRGHRGQIEAAAAMRAIMAGSEIRESHREGDSRVQDPYCIRCQPQVTGAAMDLLRQAARDAGDRGERRHRQPAGAVGRHRVGRQLPRRAGRLRRRHHRAGGRRDRRDRPAAGGADGRPDALLRPAAVPDRQPRPELGLHDRRGDDRGADEREQAPGDALLDRLDADLGQPGGPRLDGRPRCPAAGADGREPRAHPRASRRSAPPRASSSARRWRPAGPLQAALARCAPRSRRSARTATSRPICEAAAALVREGALLAASGAAFPELGA